MAIAATMSQQDEGKDDHHDYDMVMPGFRFHPTEEELIEFYLRRKVEGKRFSVELITFLDLYRYDPWELPAMAAIGEKEWFFYVPRDRKYRNGDRPNRVTTSGYWKATGADRMIRAENNRSIGLKKTLVFYSGKAPKGTRSSWIMNEYRLPQHETERLQKAEISLCRVYKRPGVEDHPSLPRSLPTTRASSSRTTQVDKKQHGEANHAAPMERFQVFGDESEKMSDTSLNSSTDAAAGAARSTYSNIAVPQAQEPTCCSSMVLPIPNGFSLVPQNPVDDLHRLVNFQQAASTNSMISQQPQYYHQSLHHFHSSQFPPLQLPQLAQPLPLPGSLHAAAFSDRVWEWSSATEGGDKDYTSPFK